MIRFRIDASPQPADLAGDLFARAEAAIEAGMVSIVTALGRAGVEEAPVRTGALQRSVTAYLTGPAAGTVAALAPYASYVHDGTGLYGPYGQLITRVDRKGRQQTRKGRHPNPFLLRALGRDDVMRSLEEGIDAYLAEMDR